MDKEMQDYKTMDLLKERRTKFEKGQQILDVSADLMGNRIRRQEKGWVAPKEDRNKKPGRVGGDGRGPAIGGPGRRRGASRGWN